ncbi:MAG: hypothetical protein Q8R79_02995 [Legionellaceae bacterium]|nr:hypothetical protein [Legionellaceae bacterium]
MKKIIFLVLYLIGFTLPSFAETMPDGQIILNCPKEIQCMVDNIIDTCYLHDNSYEIWDRTSLHNYGHTVKGLYKFKGSFSFFYQRGHVAKHSESAQTNGLTSSIRDNCIYSNTDNLGVERLIGLNPRYGFLEPFLNATSQWSIVGIVEDSYESTCLSENPSLCPLMKTPGITYIANKNNPGYFKCYYDENNPNHYDTEASYSNLLSTCGVTSGCKIDVAIPDGGWPYKKIGTVTVDITIPNFVKIVSIDTEPSSNCTLKKKDPFNAIYCEPKKKSGVIN